MFHITLAFGLALIALGLSYFVGTGSHTATPLIPAFLGLTLLILGLLGRKERLRMHVMHAAATLALFGVIGGAVMGLSKTITLLGGGEVERPAAAVESILMALLCLAFVGFCVQSFIAARRRRKSQLGEGV